ncbi:MAG: hypothetical protein DRJ42_25300 [Deltaproteobacteria bacterium]|nr:MAG: hypothetical protein DRJ42_25300 [Deltaproteobacteria bacterium]
MNQDREIQDPHLRAFSDQAGEAFEEAFQDIDLSFADVPEHWVAAWLRLVVPRPILREALER